MYAQLLNSFKIADLCPFCTVTHTQHRENDTHDAPHQFRSAHVKTHKNKIKGKMVYCIKMEKEKKNILKQNETKGNYERKRRRRRMKLTI